MNFRTPPFWYDTRSFRRKLCVKVLSPLGKIYGWLVRQRADLYYPVPLAKPVICVGNLVAGGAGKTPTVMALSDLMKEKGYNPHILTRGYGGDEPGPLQVSSSRDTAADVGDEALLLVEKAPVWVSRNRPLGAQEAIDSGANLILMDDGFQNPVIYKDFSLLVIDGAVGFGNGHVMPAGPLREPLDFGLSRAHAVLVIGDDKANVAEETRRHAPDLPVLMARLMPDADNPNIAGKNIFAFAGIGRPEKFRQTLMDAGAIVEGWSGFPDHFVYIEEDLRELITAADARGMPVITTAKDHVRLPPALKDRVLKFSVHLEWQDAGGLASLIEEALQKHH